MAYLEPRPEMRHSSPVTKKIPQWHPYKAKLSPKTAHLMPPAQRLLHGFNVATLRAGSREKSIVELPIAPVATQPRTNPLQTAVNQPTKLSLSGWLLLRPQSLGENIATAGQLGGSQTGAKISTELTSLSRTFKLNGYIRASTALTPVTAGEAAIGISLRHSARFVSELQFERRIKLSEGGRSDFALVASTSIYEVPITPLIKVEAYAQGGIVGVKARDLFIDGSVKVDRLLIENKSSALSAGVGIWAAAQPGVHRVDIGPQITLKQRLGSGAIRISGEWRFQLAGNARPSSGPSVSAGFDF